MIDVSCILINFNTSQYTINCVQSIIENTDNDVSYEIIIVDNASIYQDYEKLKLAVISECNPLKFHSTQIDRVLKLKA